MGKRIIVKGADFSTNAIYHVEVGEWYVTNYDDFASAATRTANLANGGWAFSTENDLLSGKIVNRIKFKASAAGDFPILIGETYGTMSIVRQITIESSEVGSVVEKTFEPVSVAGGQKFGFGVPNSGGFYYATATGRSFWSKVPSAPSGNNKNVVLPINVGYFV